MEKKKQYNKDAGFKLTEKCVFLNVLKRNKELSGQCKMEVAGRFRLAFTCLSRYLLSDCCRICTWACMYKNNRQRVGLF